MSKFPGLVDVERDRSSGDPFFIALAKAKGFVVVTGEKGNSKKGKPRIPDVCKGMSIDCIDILELIRREKLKF